MYIASIRMQTPIGVVESVAFWSDNQISLCQLWPMNSLGLSGIRAGGICSAHSITNGAIQRNTNKPSKTSIKSCF